MEEPVVFMSYAHSDSTIDKPWLARLSTYLEQEIFHQTEGQHVRVEQKHPHATWGDQWTERLGAGPEQHMFLIPVITPDFFDDEHCKETCERFLQREKALERDDLIVPMYYTSYPPMNDPTPLDARRRHLVEQLNAHTPVEWRDIGSKPMISSDVEAQMRAMTRRIVAALALTAPSANTQAAGAISTEQAAQTDNADQKKQPQKSDRNWVAMMMVVGFILLFLLFGVRIYADETPGMEVNPSQTRSDISDVVPRTLDIPTMTPLRLPFSSNNKIVFTSNRNNNQDIFVINADGTSLNQLTDHGADDHSPAWSPDGQYIAFTSERDGNQEIYKMTADGNNEINLTAHQAGDIEPAWSPDGERLAFVSDRNGNQNIYLMNADGAEVAQLTNNQEDRNPAWSPDGTRIVFTSVVTPTGNPEIYVIDATGTNQRQITNEPLKDAEPIWISNTQIAFVSWRDGDGDLYRMNVNGNGAELEQLTFESNNNDWDAELSPEGNELAFTSTRDTPNGNKDIFVLNLGASDPDVPRRLTDSPFDDYSPNWCCTVTR